jgi:hypothetical protein
MSEASRHRYLFLRNRLEELLAKYGPPELPPPMGIECDPTWGPLGTLARAAWGNALVEELLAMDRQTRRSEPLLAPEPPPPAEEVQAPVPEQPPQNRAPEASAPKRRRRRGADW